jgi:hypothetical protein
MKPESRPENEPAVEQQPALSPTDDRRVQARRRFLRLGAGGSAALVVTVVHKRAFAGIKKNVVASNCASLQGVPDLKNADRKKALETSAMGTPKGLICRPRDETPPICPTTSDKKSQFYKFPNDSGKQFYISANKFKNGCGSIEKTLQTSHNYRLYEKGYCPLKYDLNGLDYDRSATYFRKKDGNFILTQCEAPPP